MLYSMYMPKCVHHFLLQRVDAGDAIQGAPIGKLSTGEAITNIMNEIGYDFAIPGNHEFDYDMDRFLTLNDKLSCGYYSSNLVNTITGKNLLPAYKIFQFDDKKIALIGVTTPETLNSSTPAYFQDDKGNFIYSFNEDATGKKLYTNIQNTVDTVQTRRRLCLFSSSSRHEWYHTSLE